MTRRDFDWTFELAAPSAFSNLTEMPAQRGRKIICAYRDPSPKLEKQRAPRRKLTEEEKEKTAQLRAEQKAKKELKIKWEETLKQWGPNESFQCPKGTLLRGPGFPTKQSISDGAPGNVQERR